MNKPLFSTLILAGGYGTRLGDLGDRISKPLLQIGGKTIIDRIVENIPRDRPSDIHVLINSKFLDQYQRWLTPTRAASGIVLANHEGPSNNSAPDIVTNIVLTLEDRHIDSDLLVVGGDNLFDFSLCGFVSFGRQHGPSTVIFDVGSLEEASRFSVVTVGDDGHIASLSEKPRPAVSSLVTTCIYWFPRHVLPEFARYRSEGLPTTSIGFFVQWLVQRMPVYAFPAEGFWSDIGTTETLHRLERSSYIDDDENRP